MALYISLFCVYVLIVLCIGLRHRHMRRRLAERLLRRLGFSRKKAMTMVRKIP